METVDEHGETTPASTEEPSLQVDDVQEMAEEELEASPEDDHVQAERLLNERWVAEDQCRWTIFEDLEDELRYHRRRSRALCCFVRAYASLREEYDRLQEGGLGLQDAYEQLQDELREAVGDAAYWRELAEARCQHGGDPTVAEVSDDEGDANATSSDAKVVAPSKSTSVAVDEESETAAKEQGAEGADGAQVEPQPSDREALRKEMLKDAQAQVIRWRRLAEQRGEELDRMRSRMHSSSPAEQHPASPASSREGRARWPAGTGSLAASRLAGGASPLGLVRGPVAQSPLRPKALHQTPPRSPPSAASKQQRARAPEVVLVGGLPRSETRPSERPAAAASAHAALVRGRHNDNFSSCGNTTPPESPPQSPTPSATSAATSTATSAAESCRSRPPEAIVVGILGRSGSEPRVSASGSGLASTKFGRRSAANLGKVAVDEAPAPAGGADRASGFRSRPPPSGESSFAAANRRILSETASPCSNEALSANSSVSVPLVPTPARAWGPGSAPRRCAGLGMPTRRKQDKPPLAAPAPMERSPGAESVQGQAPLRPRTSACMSPSTSKSSRRAPVSLGQPNRRSSVAPSGIPGMDSPRLGCMTPPPPGTRTPPATQPPFRPPPPSFSHSSPSSPGTTTRATASTKGAEGSESEGLDKKLASDLVGLWESRRSTAEARPVGRR